MKRYFLSASLILCTLLFNGCSESNIDKIKQNETDTLSIVTTCFPAYDLARAVKGSDENITMLLCTGAEAHSYEPTPLDILKIQQCDMFIYIGGEGEVWADEILESMDTSDKYILKLSDYAELLDEVDILETNNVHSHHHSHSDNEEDDEHEECEFDEHIWTSPENMIRMTKAVGNAFIVADTPNSQIYTGNVEKYEKELFKLDEAFEKFSEQAESENKNLIVVGDRFPFRYLAKDYHLDYYSAFSGCSSESEPSIHTMAFLIDAVLENNIKNVFYLEFSTKKVAQKLCEATGSEMLQLHSCHNVSGEDFENGITYIDLMYRNLSNLKRGLLLNE
ncbi:MAG: metal ABC transporter substrate-binding protein [Oscillospiraceae bacterium]|nr:metal ABC transporter substrate-binding protein [Oscillospiraceae bacterium]